MLSALMGGIVSTTAVTASLASRVRQNPEFARSCGIAGVMANAVQFPRLLLLVWVVDRSLGAFVTAPLLGMGAVGIIGAWFLWRAQNEKIEDSATDLVVQNPYSLMPALKFGLFFVGVTLLAKIATFEFGDRGIYLTSAIAGLGDASAISLSAAKLVSHGSLSVVTAWSAIFIAVLMNALLKFVLAWRYGSRHLGVWIGSGFAAMLGTGFLLMALKYTI